MLATVTTGNVYSKRDSFPILVYFLPLFIKKIIRTKVNKRTLLIIVIGTCTDGRVTITVRFSPKIADPITIVINSDIREIF